MASFNIHFRYMNTTQHTEVAIIGAGIMGMAVALAEAKRGARVTLFERDAHPVGATIRNFGMLWPIGQPAGPLLERALRSRAIWQDVARQSGLSTNPCGSLHLAYHKDEWDILREFAEQGPAMGYDVELLGPKQVAEISPAAHPNGLLGGLFSRTEIIIDARQAPRILLPWMQKTLKVTVRPATNVLGIGQGRLRCTSGSWSYDRAYVCSGADLHSLFPEILSQAPIVLTKLQMMRTAPQPANWRMGPALAAGLTLQHYASFGFCEGLPTLQQRISNEMPWANKWGIHVMMSQNPQGELLIGDSHEYGPTHDPFIREDLNRYILDYLQGFARIPSPAITERWYGIYGKRTDGLTEFIARVDETTTLITGIGGTGMTMSFGLGDDLLNGRYEERHIMQTSV